MPSNGYQIVIEIEATGTKDVYSTIDEVIITNGPCRKPGPRYVARENDINSTFAKY